MYHSENVDNFVVYFYLHRIVRLTPFEMINISMKIHTNKITLGELMQGRIQRGFEVGESEGEGSSSNLL